MKHGFLAKFSTLLTVAVAGGMMAAALLTEAPDLHFQWRWFALPIMASLAATLILLGLVLKRSTSRRGPLYWFMLLLMSNIGLLVVTLLTVLAADPGTASYWQGSGPMLALFIPVGILFFAVSFVDDSDFPFSPLATTAIIIGTGSLGFLCGLTNLMESHVPLNAALEYWGYQSTPGDYAAVVYGWFTVFGISSVALMIRALRSEINERKKRQLRIFSVGLALYIGIGVVLDIVLYQLFPHDVPPMSFLYTTILSLTIGYGILRHGIFQISPAALSGPILQNLAEAVMGLGANLKVEFGNASASYLLRYPPDTLRGMPARTLLPEAQYRLLMEHINGGWSTFRLDDTAILNSEGNSVPVSLAVTQIHDDYGRLAGYIFAAENISEVKKKAAALAREKASVERKVRERTAQLSEEQAKLEASIQSLRLGFALVDEKDQIMIQNRSMGQVVGRKSQISKAADIDTFFAGAMDLAAARQKVLEGGSERQARDLVVGDRIFNVFIGSVKLTDNKHGKIIGAVILVEDITKDKELERMEADLVTLASHQLRTPATVVKTSLAMLIDGYMGALTPDQLGALKTAFGENQNELRLIDDIIDLNELDSEKVLINPVELGVLDLVRKAVQENEIIIGERGHEVSMSIDKSLKVTADRDRIGRVVDSLVANAVKYTPAGGKIMISAARHGGRVKISVRDNGVGIPRPQLSQLFTRFWRASNAQTVNMAGAGLELHIAKRLVEMHGGELEAESVEGKGSVFTVTLPASGGASAADAPIR